MLRHFLKTPFDYRVGVMMRLFLFGLLSLLFLPLRASYSDWFEERTLRLDFIFSGDSATQHISLDQMSSFKGWAGRRQRLDSLVLEGMGQIWMEDSETGKVLYKHSFCTLFQEWQLTPEAGKRSRSFENCFLLPMPRKEVKVTVCLLDGYRKVSASQSFTINPTDALIQNKDGREVLPYKYLHRGGESEKCIDVVIVAEGYRKGQQKLFYRDAQRMCDEILSYEPFKDAKENFNVVAVAAPSEDEGVSVPQNGVWKNTAVNSHFDTFYSDRYLTTLNLKKLNDLLIGIPYEHIIILANTETYGGGGIYNLYMMSAAHNKYSLPVCVHEFGHSFAGLADEYVGGTDSNPFYHAGIEPWEKNITTLTDFSSKWQKMLPEGTSVPTPEGASKDWTTVGVFEGGGYLTHGVYRPAQNCRMRENGVPAYCPVCQEAIREVIRFYTE